MECQQAGPGDPVPWPLGENVYRGHLFLDTPGGWGPPVLTHYPPHLVCKRFRGGSLPQLTSAFFY